jgi:hypothetical protein
MSESYKINYLAVLASIIWLFVLGFLWYGPILGEPWMKLVGLTMAEVEANPPGASIWIANIIGSGVPVLIMAFFFSKMNVQSAMTGLIYGLLIGFCFNLMPTIVNGLFAKSPYGLAWITGGFQTVGWGVTGLILGGWRKK